VNECKPLPHGLPEMLVALRCGALHAVDVSRVDAATGLAAGTYTRPLLSSTSAVLDIPPRVPLSN